MPRRHNMMRILRGETFGWLRVIFGERRRRKMTLRRIREFEEHKRKQRRDALNIPAIMENLEKMTELFEGALKPDVLAELKAQRARQAGTPEVYSAEKRTEAMEDFEAYAMLDAFEALTTEMSWVLDRNREKLWQAALDLYYDGEEVMRNSTDEKGIAAYQDFREAMEKEYGGPLPPREKN